MGSPQLGREGRQRHGHGLGAVHFVDLSGFPEGGFDDVTVVVIELDIVFEDVRSLLDADDVVNNQFAE